MKRIITAILMISSLLVASKSYGQNTIVPEDLNILLGDWKGDITYVDYGTNEPFTMPAEMVIKKGKNKYQFQLFINYPKEKNANSKDKIKISKDGTRINNIDIKSIETFSDGQLQIITEYLGKDDNKKAQIRNTYNFGKTNLFFRKEVKFETSKNWIVRNEYNYAK